MCTHQILSDQIEKNGMDRACGTYGDRRGLYRFFFFLGRLEGRSLGRPRNRWDGSSGSLIGVDACKCGNEPSGSTKFE